MAVNQVYGEKKGQTKVNYAVGGNFGFQGGSTFKAFVLADAIRQGIPLSLTLYSPQEYTSDEFVNYTDDGVEQYTISNASDSESGTFDLREATHESVNTYYLQLLERTGVDGPAGLAEALGRAARPRPRRQEQRPAATAAAASSSAPARSARWRWPAPTPPSPRTAPTAARRPSWHHRRPRQAGRRPRARVHPGARAGGRRHRQRRAARRRRAAPAAAPARRRLRPPRRRQDRHDEQLPRRLVRRLHAPAGHGRLGRAARREAARRCRCGACGSAAATTRRSTAAPSRPRSSG